MSIGAIPIPPAIDPAIAPPPIADPALPVPLPDPLAPPPPAPPIVPPAVPTPIIPPPKTPEEAAQQNLTEAKQLGDDSVRVAQEKADLDTKLANEKAEFAKKHQAALEQVQQRQEFHRQEAEKQVTEARAKAESEPYHSYWESRTNGQKAMIGIGLILNGVSWNPQHTNRGVTMLHDAMNNEMELQKAKHADLWKAVNEAQEGVRELDQHELRELSAFSATEGAKWDAIAGRLSAAAAANRGKGDVNVIKKQALEASEKAATAWQNAVAAAATANHHEEIDKERIRHDQEMEKLRAKKLAGSGGGGASGSPAQQKAAVEIREAIEKAKSEGKPLSDAQVARLAFDKKIPEVAKAGRISLKTIMDDMKKSADIGRVDATIGEKDAARTVHWNGKDWLAPRANQVKDIAKDIGNIEKYNDLIHEIASDIRKNGFIIDPGGEENPQTEKGKRRMSAMAELQALGRQISALQATDAGQKLEHQMIGHAGVGIKPGIASPDVLTELGARANKLINTKFKAMLTPVNKDASQPEKKWVPIPSRLSGEPEAKGKKEMLISFDGKFLGEFR